MDELTKFLLNCARVVAIGFACLEALIWSARRVGEFEDREQRAEYDRALRNGCLGHSLAFSVDTAERTPEQRKKCGPGPQIPTEIQQALDQ